MLPNPYFSHFPLHKQRSTGEYGVTAILLNAPLQLSLISLRAFYLPTMLHLKKLSQQRSLNFQTLLKRRRNLLCWLDVGSSNRRGVFIGGVPMNSQFIRLMFVPMVLALGLVASDSYADKATCLLYTSPRPRDVEESRMPSSA